MANALNRNEGLSPRAFTPAIVRRDAFGRRPAFRTLIAEVGGRRVGYTSYVDGYNTDIAARELFMLDLYVRPAWRSRGIGRRLLAAVARETRRRGFTCLEWGVRGSNLRARRFYRRLGATIGQARIASLSGRSLTTIAAAGGRPRPKG